MGIMFDPDDLLYATVYIATESSPLLYTVDHTFDCPFLMQATIIGNTGLDFPHGGDFGCPSQG
jgi:hypothetical protein